MLDSGFQPCITEPTRIAYGNKPSIVDNIFINSIETCCSGNLYNKISDHLPNFVIIENVKNKPKPKYIKRRNMKNFVAANFQADLLLILRKIENVRDAESSFQYFHEKYIDVVDKHAPFQTLTRKLQELKLKP